MENMAVHNEEETHKAVHQNNIHSEPYSMEKDQIKTEKEEDLTDSEKGIDKLSSDEDILSKKLDGMDAKMDHLDEGIRDLKTFINEGLKKYREIINYWEKNAIDEKEKNLELRENRLKENQENITQLKDENRRLNDQLHNAEKEAQNYYSELQETIKEKNNSDQNLATLTKKYQSFDRLLEFFERYQSLDIRILDRTRPLLPDDDPLHFVLRGSQGDQLLPFWEELKKLCDGTPDEKSLWAENQKTLNDVLQFLLDQYNVGWDKGKDRNQTWSLMEVAEGEPFDRSRHIAGKESSAHVGPVTEVRLRGIINVKNNEVKKRSVVIHGSQTGL